MNLGNAIQKKNKNVGLCQGNDFSLPCYTAGMTIRWILLILMFQFFFEDPNGKIDHLIGAENVDIN